MGFLLVLASALAPSDQVLHQVQGASTALGELDPPKATQCSYSQTRPLNRFASSAVNPDEDPGNRHKVAVCKSLVVQVSVKCTDKIIIIPPPLGRGALAIKV